MRRESFGVGRNSEAYCAVSPVNYEWRNTLRYSALRATGWLDLQSQYDIAVVEREKGGEITKRVRPADAAKAAAKSKVDKVLSLNRTVI